MLQPVGQGINTQSILAAGCCIVSGMVCENVYPKYDPGGLFSRVLFSLRAILIRMLSRSMMSWCDVVLEQMEAVVASSSSSKKYQ